MYYSQDGGASWRRVAVSLRGKRVFAAEVAASDVRHIWILDSGGRLLRTADGGANWSAIGFKRGFGGGVGTAALLGFVDSRTGFASVSGIGEEDREPAMITRDGGKTWTALPLASDSLP